MRENDKARFIELLTATAAVYGKDLIPAVIELYWEDLEDLSFEEVATGLARHRKEPERGHFWPTPGDVIRHIHGDPETRALLAWTKFVATAERVGAYRSVAFDDPYLMAVVEDMGGWARMSSWEADDEPFIRNEFVKRYKGYLFWSEPQVQRLKGLHQAANERTSLPDPRFKDGIEIAFIGDQEHCLRILREDEDVSEGLRRFFHGLDRGNMER